jgi:hypothetical protein
LTGAVVGRTDRGLLRLRTRDVPLLEVGQSSSPQDRHGPGVRLIGQVREHISLAGPIIGIVCCEGKHDEAHLDEVGAVPDHDAAPQVRRSSVSLTATRDPPLR